MASSNNVLHPFQLYDVVPNDEPTNQWFGRDVGIEDPTTPSIDDIRPYLVNPLSMPVTSESGQFHSASPVSTSSISNENSFVPPPPPHPNNSRQRPPPATASRSRDHRDTGDGQIPDVTDRHTNRRPSSHRRQHGRSPYSRDTPRQSGCDIPPPCPLVEEDEEEERVHEYHYSPIPAIVRAASELPGHRIRFHVNKGWYVLNEMRRRIDPPAVARNTRPPDLSVPQWIVDRWNEALRTGAALGEIDYCSSEVTPWSYLHAPEGRGGGERGEADRGCRRAAAGRRSGNGNATGGTGNDHAHPTLPGCHTINPRTSSWNADAPVAWGTQDPFIPWTQFVSQTPFVPTAPFVPPAAPSVSLVFPRIPVSEWRQASFTPNIEPGTFPAVPLGDPGILMKLHPNILLNPINPRLPQLQWRVTCHPQSARTVIGHLDYGFPSFGEGAVVPSLRTLKIDPDNMDDLEILTFWMNHWGPIVIRKDHDITVGDILEEIYNYFQRPLSLQDKRTACSTQENAGRLREAKEVRSQHADGLPGYILQSPEVRSDMMGGLVYFQGLRAEVFTDGTYRLCLSLTTRSTAHRMAWGR